jgi:hypothetical protein
VGLSPTVRGVSAVQIELAFQGDSCMMREAAHMRSNEAGGLPSNSAFREGPDALTWFQRKAAEHDRERSCVPHAKSVHEHNAGDAGDRSAHCATAAFEERRLLSLFLVWEGG